MTTTIVRDARPFFFVPNDVIDSGLSSEAVACYMYVCRFGHAEAKVIRRHFGLTRGQMDRVWHELRAGGFVSEQPTEGEA